MATQFKPNIELSIVHERKRECIKRNVECNIDGNLNRKGCPHKYRNKMY